MNALRKSLVCVLTLLPRIITAKLGKAIEAKMATMAMVIISSTKPKPKVRRPLAPERQIWTGIFPSPRTDL